MPSPNELGEGTPKRPIGGAPMLDPIEPTPV
jgi:hypothetical protein